MGENYLDMATVIVIFFALGIVNGLSCWLYNEIFPRFDFEIIKIESTWEQKEFRINM